jgi:archaellum biogenesis protein FlaJ (TadC family)
MLPVGRSLLTEIFHSKILNEICLICRNIFLHLVLGHRSVRKNYIVLRCLSQGHKIKHFFFIQMRVLISCILSIVASLNTSISNRAYHKSAAG